MPALVSSSVLHVVLVVMAMARVDRAFSSRRQAALVAGAISSGFALSATRWAGLGWTPSVAMAVVIWALAAYGVARANNTSDEDLWRPVQRHCERLGARLRFVHVQGISGAKAGALNWSMQYLDPHVELIEVVDADYRVSPDWLSDSVGHFEDARVGFVQCPHAYRDVEWSPSAHGQRRVSRLLRDEHVSLSEHGAGITVGTSLIRTKALFDAGGWGRVVPHGATPWTP